MRSGLIDEPLVTALYDAALYAGNWRPALERLRCLLGSREAAISLWDGEVAQTEAAAGCLTAERRESYVRWYRALDPKNRIFSRRGVGFLFNDVRHFDETFVAHDPFYQEFSRPMGTRHTLDMLIADDGRTQAYLATMRSDRQGAYDTHAEELFRNISRHFLQAVKLRQKLDASQLLAASARAALDKLRLGVIVLDASGQVAIVNRAAERATAPGEPLQLRQGRLSARAARAAAEMEALIRAALPPHRTAGALRVPRSDRSAWSVWAAPLPADTPISVRGEFGALVLIGSADGDPALRREELVALYDLTSAEFELARALCGGATLTQAAGARGVKISTARSQLLSILQKTGARGQADLIRMLALLPSASLDSI